MTKQDLYTYLDADASRFGNKRPNIKDRLLHNEDWYIYQYVRRLRYVEYFGDKNRLLYLWHYFFYKRLGFKLHITIYPGTIGPGFRIWHLGDFIHVGPNVRIGKNCTMLPGVVFGYTKKMRQGGANSVIVGDNCSFGQGAKVLGAVRIGNNVNVGANAVVTHDIPDNAVVGGVPARVIKIKD